MIQYDLKDLRLFVLVARLRSFRLAAERMFMTVSAASVRIRKLEESFKTQLLIRHPRDVELTEAGERFLKDAQTVLDQTDNLENHMQRFSGRQDNTVRLFTSYSAITGRLKSDIAQFLLRYPDGSRTAHRTAYQHSSIGRLSACGASEGHVVAALLRGACQARRCAVKCSGSFSESTGRIGYPPGFKRRNARAGRFVDYT